MACERCGGYVIGRICQDCMASPGEDAAVSLPPEHLWADAEAIA
jgi:rRNA maturation protein Nop10